MLALRLLPVIVLAAGCNCGGQLQRTSARLAVSPTRVDFGPLPAGQSATRMVTLSTSGKGTLAYSARLEGDGRGAFSLSGAMSGTLEEGASRDISIDYRAPVTEGADGTTLVLETDSRATPEVAVSISARSVSSADAGTRDAGQPDAGAADAGQDAGPPRGPCASAPDVLDHVLVDGGSSGQTSVARAGANALFVFGGFGTVTTQLISPAGSPAGVLHRVVDAGSAYPEVMANDVGFGLTTNDLTTLYFHRLDATGATLAITRVPASAGTQRQIQGHLAWNPLDRQWGVLWNEAPMAGGSNSEHFGRLGEDGAFISGSAVNLGPAYPTGSGTPLTWMGDRFGAVWGSTSGLNLHTVTRSGAAASVVFSARAPMTLQGPFSAEWSGAELGVAWVEIGLSVREVKFTRVSASGVKVGGSDRTLASWTPASMPFLPTVDLVFTGNGWIVAWSQSQDTASNTDLWVARIDATGNEVAGSKRVITCGPNDELLPNFASGPAPVPLTWVNYGAPLLGHLSWLP